MVKNPRELISCFKSDVSSGGVACLKEDAILFNIKVVSLPGVCRAEQVTPLPKDRCTGPALNLTPGSLLLFVFPTHFMFFCILFTKTPTSGEKSLEKY